MKRYAVVFEVSAQADVRGSYDCGCRVWGKKEAHDGSENRRRFDSGLRNFQDVSMELVDTWEWYDNSGNTPRLISAGANAR